MPCTHVRLPGGQIAIVCGPRDKPKRCACGSGKPATLLCDWKVVGGVCDAPLCDDCTHTPASDKDLCPRHAEEWRGRIPRTGR